MERVEPKLSTEQRRSPNDIDVVTFFYPPAGDPREHTELFDTELTREKYRIDAYGVVMGTVLTTELVGTISYWHGMWSLSRTGQHGKGFVQVELDPTTDQEAREALNAATR